MTLAGQDSSRREVWWLAGLLALAWTILWLAVLAWNGLLPWPEGLGGHAAQARPPSGRAGGIASGGGLLWLGGLVVIGLLVQNHHRNRRERDRLARAAQDSEERFQLAVHATEDQVLDVDLSANAVLYCTPALAEMLGLPGPQGQSVVEGWLGRTHEEDRVRVRAALRRHTDGLAPRFEAQFRLLQRDGQHRWFMVRGQVLRDGEGRPWRLLGVFTDIGPRKAQEAKLQEEQDKVLVALSSIGDAVVTTDAEGSITFMNPKAEHLTGWRLDEALGLPAEAVVTLIEEHSRKPLSCQLDKCRRFGREDSPLGPILLIDRAGREVAVEESVAPLTGRDGASQGMVMVFRDVTRSREMHRQLAWQVAHDALTGLVSRREFERRLEAMIEDSRVNDSVHALLYMDLDRFKTVNDTCGHLAGDELLKQVAFLLSEHMRRNDTLARLGGDEFGALLENCPPEKAREIAEKLRQTVSGLRFTWQDKGFQIGVSIGLVMIDRGVKSIDEALTAVDSACYAAKDAGRDRVHVYRPGEGHDAGHERELQMVTDIRVALAQDRFVLHAQEVQPLSPGEHRHYEVLVRMVNGYGRIVSPGLFVPIAERNGLMPAVDRWVIRRALQMLSETGQAGRDIRLFLNLSGLSFRDEDLVAYIRDQLDATGIDPARICFEVTETAAVAQLATGVRFMRELQALGCRFALDDFGSGMSSFVYLKNLPVNYLKIDGAFVRNMLDDPVDHAFVETINRIGQLMGKRTIAEFVESDAIRHSLQKIGVDYAQGKVVGMPRPLEAVLQGL